MASVAFSPGGVFRNQQQQPSSPTPLQNQYNLYNSGVGQNAQDYRDIMSGYKNQLTAANNRQQVGAGTYTPENYNYNPTKDYTNAYGQANDLATTGGYSPEQINQLRERGISPIRSVYANANREVDRNRRLQGGFSANYNAVKAKMAREMSNQIASQMNDVNAGIAQNVAANRLAALPTLSNLGQFDSTNQNAANQRSTEARNAAQQFNITSALDAARLNQQNSTLGLQALQGMNTLYGTTPALANLFGNQALGRANFENNVIQDNNRNNLAALGTAMRL